jgi:hypothetical protein
VVTTYNGIKVTQLAGDHCLPHNVLRSCNGLTFGRASRHSFIDP